MKEKIKGIANLIIIIIVVYLGYKVVYLGYNFLFKKDTYRGFYYPDGCLVCDDYMVSPDLNYAEDCIKWAEGIKGQSGNPNDLWECGKNCKWEDGFSICETTFGEEGTGIHF